MHEAVTESNAHLCRHCHSPVPAREAATGFCCPGCAAVYQLLTDQKLDRYYALAGNQVVPVAATEPHGRAWLEPLLDTASGALDLDVQGLHCAACVWLLDELARRRGTSAIVNPARGTMRLLLKPGFDPRRYVDEVEQFGYRLGPPSKVHARPSSSGRLTLRLGISAALTINVMIFAVSFYTGLSPREGEVFRLFSRLTFVLATLVVLVGGSLFFRSAWQALRRRVLHLDIPIASGILLAYVASVAQVAGAHGDRSYLDTLCVFVTLMLLGRWIEERVLDRNRRLLFDDDGLGSLTVQRRLGRQTENIPASAIVADDELLLAPGDLLAVDATLLSTAAAISREWTTGEPDVVGAALGERIGAGACNRGRAAVWLRAECTLADSSLATLLAAAVDRDTVAGVVPAYARFADRLARGWVLTVLGLAVAALLYWLHRDASRAIDVTVALLVVTCPCAIGIAMPLGSELVQARLRKAGFYTRRRDLLARLDKVRTVIFDKTGTLTLGRLQLVDEAPLDALSTGARDAAYTLATASSHPASRCLATALAARGAHLVPTQDAAEEPGQGGRANIAGSTWTLGRIAAGGGTVLQRDGQTVAAFELVELLRSDARAQMTELRARNYAVRILSGDAPERVARVASSLGLPADAAEGGLSPDDKAARIAAIGANEVLYLGDGVNDTRAFATALIAGTPAIDRPIIPGRADFFLVGEGLGGVGLALALARRLARVQRATLFLSLSYNALVVAACFAGYMTPLRAAVAMPLSSIAILTLTILGLRQPARKPSQPRANPASVNANPALEPA